METSSATIGLAVRGVSSSYNKDTVLRDVSLELARGEYFALVGPSGAGKSTLLRVIAGHVKPDRGEVVIAGSPAGDSPPASRATSLMFQEYSLFDHMTSLDNILFPLRVQGKLDGTQVERAMALAKTAGLGAKELNKRPLNLSGGERQRVALVRAIVWEPQVLLLDEPLAAVDPSLRDGLSRLLVNLSKGSGVTTVHVTHSLREAFDLADRVGIMLDGRLAQIGPAASVYATPETPEVAAFLGYLCLDVVVVRGSAPERAPWSTVGARPTSVLAGNAGPDEVDFQGVVRRLAFLSDDCQQVWLVDVVCSADGDTKSVRIAQSGATRHWKSGETVTLRCAVRDLVAWRGNGPQAR